MDDTMMGDAGYGQLAPLPNIGRLLGCSNAYDFAFLNARQPKHGDSDLQSRSRPIQVNLKSLYTITDRLPHGSLTLNRQKRTRPCA